MLMLITAISKNDQREGGMNMLPDSTMWTSLFSDVGTNHITSPGKLFWSYIVQNKRKKTLM